MWQIFVVAATENQFVQKKCIQSKFYRNTMNFKFMCIIVCFHFHRNQARKNGLPWSMNAISVVWNRFQTKRREKLCWPTFKSTGFVNAHNFCSAFFLVRKISCNGNSKNENKQRAYNNNKKRQGKKMWKCKRKSVIHVEQTKVKQIVMCTRRNSKNQPTLSKSSLN